MKVRIKFSKHGVLKYIGHLDLMRYFQKAFRRTDIDVLYSKGFSPHMIMSFAQPLGVGVESDGEYFDVEVADDENVSTIVERLNVEMAEGIAIHDAIILPEKTINAMASVAAAAYEIHFHKSSPLSNELMEKYESTDNVEFIKVTKTGEHPINVKDFVFEISIKDSDTLFAVVDCSSAGNLKPSTLVTSLLSLNNLDVNDYPYHVTRKETYKRTQDNKLVPLNFIDEE